jgi:hypothetical protein
MNNLGKPDQSLPRSLPTIRAHCVQRQPVRQFPAVSAFIRVILVPKKGQPDFEAVPAR